MEKDIYENATSAYTAPALESTLLIDTGGLDDPNPIGNTPSIPVSAAVSSGARALQYNRYYYNNDVYSFNYNNGSIGIVIAYYNAKDSVLSSVIYMITLPRVAMTLLSSLDSSSPTSNPNQRLLLLKELVYYLNMGWTSYGLQNTQDFPQTIPFKIGPLVYGFEYKGFLPDPSVPVGGKTLNNEYMPIFSDSSEPPLLWSILSSNGQLALVRNPNFFVEDKKNDLIAYQIVSPQSYFGQALQVVKNGVASPTSTTIPGGYFINTALNSDKGWCGQGAFATGFAQRKTYASDAREPYSYNDIYTNDERFSLFSNLHFPVFESITVSTTEFFEYCSTFKLITGGFLISNFITSMIPSRFYTIESAALTRNQKRPPCSNNPNIIGDTVAVIFLTLDKLRTWQDSTISGIGGSQKSSLFPSRKSGTDDTSIVYMDPMQSLQVLDLTMRDEWGNIIDNYSSISDKKNYIIESFIGQIPGEEYIYGFVEGLYLSPNSFPIPAWVSVYNPILDAGNTESILLNENWWTNWATIFTLNSLKYANSNISADVTRSSTYVHFARVLGY